MKILGDIKDEYTNTPKDKVVLVLGMTLVETAIFLAPAILVGQIIDLVVANQATKITLPLFILAVLGVVQTLLWPIRERFVARVVQSVVLNRSKRLTNEVFRKDYEIFASSRVGYVTKIVERAIEGFEQLLGVLLTQALPAIASVLLVAVYFIFLLPIGVPILIIGATVYLAVSKKVLKWRRNFLDNVNDAEDDIADSFAATFLAARAIKSSGTIKDALSPLTRTYQGYAETAAKLAFASGVLASVQTATTLAVTILTIYGGVVWLGVSESFTAGDFVIVFSYVGIFMSNLGVAWKVREAVDDYEADTRALSKIQSLPSLERDTSLSQQIEKPNISIGASDGEDLSSLKVRTDLEIKFGELVAIVGQSGAGKTTLLQHLAGIRKSGSEVKLGGYEISRLSPTQITELIDYAWQEPQFLFGNWEEAVFFRKLTSKEKERAASLSEMLGISHLFLPKQSDFRVDNLSGGEKRRLALLRIFTFPKPILILDEPVSELDSKHSAAVCSIITELKGHSTVIVATHDSELQQVCGMVLSIQNHEIVELS